VKALNILEEHKNKQVEGEILKVFLGVVVSIVTKGGKSQTSEYSRRNLKRGIFCLWDMLLHK
jgi:hypothetical protein